MAQLDRLQQDAAHLKEELQTLAGELESRTSQAALIEEQAEALVHEAEHQAASKVLLKMLLSSGFSWLRTQDCKGVLCTSANMYHVIVTYMLQLWHLAH